MFGFAVPYIRLVNSDTEGKLGFVYREKFILDIPLCCTSYKTVI
jgi:hypothetical protein